jgi:hypothetical protein
MNWWINELNPIIYEIINKKSGHCNLAFRLSMLRIHDDGIHYNLTWIEGWFVKIFLYTTSGINWIFEKSIWLQFFRTGCCACHSNLSLWTKDKIQTQWSQSKANSYRVSLDWFKMTKQLMSNRKSDGVCSLPIQITFSKYHINAFDISSKQFCLVIFFSFWIIQSAQISPMDSS